MPFQVALIAALLKVALILGSTLLVVPMLVWLERKLIAAFQARIGPDRVGKFGLLQSFVDGIKLVCKEEVVPNGVDRLLYFAGPVVTMIPALTVGALIPFGPPVKIGGYTHDLVMSDLPVGALFVLAITSLGVYGIVLSGWSSNNKYSLLGGLRASAQMVSYELPMGLCVVAALMIASQDSPTGVFSMRFSEIVDAQSGTILNWTAFNYHFPLLGLLAMVVFYICGLAETNRAPFDLPEAETELIGGYHTEYGGLRWAMFFMGEYAAMLNVASVTATLFLGGWRPPYPSPLPAGSVLAGFEGAFWLVFKIGLVILLYMWIRATLPRLRYDQLMGFGWKILIPVGLLNIFLIAGILTFAFPEKAPSVLVPATTSASSPAPPPSSMPGGMGGIQQLQIPGGAGPAPTAPPVAPSPAPGAPGVGGR